MTCRIVVESRLVLHQTWWCGLAGVGGVGSGGGVRKGGCGGGGGCGCGGGSGVPDMMGCKLSFYFGHTTGKTTRVRR